MADDHDDAHAEEAFAPDATPAPPPATPARVPVEVFFDLMGDRIERLLRQELSQAMGQIASMRNAIELLARSVQRIEERLDMAQGAGLSPIGAPGGGVTERLAGLERQVRQVEDEATREILDAIVSVAQHLEAVQTAAAWTIVSEMRAT